MAHAPTLWHPYSTLYAAFEVMSSNAYPVLSMASSSSARSAAADAQPEQRVPHPSAVAAVVRHGDLERWRDGGENASSAPARSGISTL